MTRDLWTQLFAIRLRAKMAAANISSAELAGKYEFWTEGLIESYRKGKTIPPAYDLALLANTLGCTIEYLADFKMLSGLNEKECMKILELSEKYQIDPCIMIASVKAWWSETDDKYEALGNLLDACCKERDKTSIVGEWISPFDRGPDIDRDVLIKDKDGNRFVGHRNANYGWMSNDDYTQLDVYDLVGWVEIPE